MPPIATGQRIIPRLAAWLAAMGLLLAPAVTFAATTNYTTGFESAEGYVGGNALAGQQGWIGYAVATNLTHTNATSAGSGITLGGLGGTGQAAYVGLTPLTAPFNSYVELLQTVSLDPVGTNQPHVHFSTRVKIIDSTAKNYDYFYWDFYNLAGDYLFGLEFNNIFFRLSVVNSTNQVVKLLNYVNATEYALGVTMNFASNRYSVTWNGVLLTNNIPITINGAALSLGSISAIWHPTDPTQPGDNFMIFDDVRLISSALIPPRPQLRVLTPGGSSAATVRLTGQEGFRFAVDGSTNLVNWLAVNTNIVSGGTADYLDTNAPGKNVRHYRARWVP